MNNEEIRYAAALLATELRKQLGPAIEKICTDVMIKFDRGPKPRPDEKAQIKLMIEIEGRSMYEVADRIRMMKEGYVKKPTNNRIQRP